MKWYSMLSECWMKELHNGVPTLYQWLLAKQSVSCYLKKRGQD